MNSERFSERFRGADVDAGVVAFGFVVVALGVVDAVDLCGLGVAGVGGHGEVGVAAGLEEDFDFVVDAAPAAVGAGVVQGPVAVNEGVAGGVGVLSLGC